MGRGKRKETTNASYAYNFIWARVIRSFQQVSSGNPGLPDIV
jgi:hypothetical protein